MIGIDPNATVDPKILEERRDRVLEAARNWFRSRIWALPPELMAKAEAKMHAAAGEYNAAMDIDQMLSGLRGERTGPAGMAALQEWLRK